MKKLIVLTLFGLSAGATMAQTTAGGANNQSSSSATTSAQGNTQAVTFSSPADVTTRSTLSSNQNVNNTGATTNTVDYQGSYTIKNVPSVNGPNLTTSNDTCMGSSSASANGPGVGLSFGTTWTDEHCKRLKMSRELWNKGMKAASLAMDCMDPQAMAALEMTGTKCPQSMTAEERVTAYGPQASSAGAPAVAARPAAAPVAAAAPAPAPVAAAVLPVDTAPPVAKASPVAATPAVPAPQAAAVLPAAEEAPAAVTMPVALGSVTPVDLGVESDPIASILARRLGEPVGDVASAPQASGLSQ